MQGQFDRALKDAYRFIDNALVVVSPELADNEVRAHSPSPPPSLPANLHLRRIHSPQAERLKRLARFSLATMKAQKRIHMKVQAQATLRSIHDSALACKLELFRCAPAPASRDQPSLIPASNAHRLERFACCLPPYPCHPAAPCSPLWCTRWS